jgi:hypothetical protein
MNSSAQSGIVEKHFQQRSAELQIPPLRYAPVGMTKGRAAPPIEGRLPRIMTADVGGAAEQKREEKVFIPLGGPPGPSGLCRMTIHLQRPSCYLLHAALGCS